MKRQTLSQVPFHSQTGPPSAPNLMWASARAGVMLNPPGLDSSSPVPTKDKQPIPNRFGLPQFAGINGHPGTALQNGYSLPTQDSRNLMRQSVDSTGELSNSGSDDVQYASKEMVQNLLLNMDIPMTQFTKAINFEAISNGSDPVYVNGYNASPDEMDDGESVATEDDEDHGMLQYSLDTSADLVEQQQAQQQSVLMKQFKQLREWQQQQQEMLMLQQQQQLEKLQEEQERVQRMIAKQREMQWGTPGNGKNGLSNFSSQMAAGSLMMSPRRSTVQPGEATSKSLRPSVVLLTQRQSEGPPAPQLAAQKIVRPIPSIPHQESTPLEYENGDPLDSDTVSQQSYCEDGIYPLPDNELQQGEPSRQELRPHLHQPHPHQGTRFKTHNHVDITHEPHTGAFQPVAPPRGVTGHSYHSAVQPQFDSGHVDHDQTVSSEDFSDDDYEDVTDRVSCQHHHETGSGDRSPHYTEGDHEQRLYRGTVLDRCDERETVKQRDVLDFREDVDGNKQLRYQGHMDRTQRGDSGASPRSPREEYQDEFGMDEEVTGMEELSEEEAEVESRHDGTTCFDDMPVLGLAATKKTFEELLEEELRKEEQRLQQKESGTSSSGGGKRQFLKKGEGVARFAASPARRTRRSKPTPALTKLTLPSSQSRENKTASGSSSRANVNSQRPAAVCTTGSGSISSGSVRTVDRQNETHVTRGLPPKGAGVSRRVINGQVQHPPQQKQKAPQQQRESQQSQHKQQLQVAKPPSGKEKKILSNVHKVSPSEKVVCKVSDNESLGETSFQNCLEARAELEVEQLEEFELLEHYADDNASFMSNLSAVERVVHQTKQVQQRHPLGMQPIRNIVKPPPKPAVPLNPPRGRPENDTETSSESESEDETSITTDFDEHEDSEDEAVNKDSNDVRDDTLVESPTGDSPQAMGDSAEAQRSSGESCPRKVASLQGRSPRDPSSRNLLMSVQQFSDSEPEYMVGPAGSQPQAEVRTRVNEPEGSLNKDELDGIVVHSAEVAAENTDVCSHNSQNHTNSGGQKKESSHRYIETTDDDQSVSDVLETNRDVNGSDPIAQRIDFDDDEAWDEDSRCEESTPVVKTTRSQAPLVSQAVIRKTVVTKTKVYPDHTEEDCTPEDPTPMTAPVPPPTSTLVTKLFPQLKKVAGKPNLPPQAEQQLETATQVEAPDGAQSKALRDKLMELEREIEKFRSENAALTKLRKEREDALAELRKEMAEFDKQKDEELKRLQAFKAEETKKLKREKKQFEQYQKAMKTMPDKKEREEIEALKIQVSELQEELKRKESRWSSSTARLRERIDQLTTENSELKEEIGILEKQRLLAWQQKEAAPKLKEESRAPPAPRKATLSQQKSPKPESQPTKFVPHDNMLRLGTNLELDDSDLQEEFDEIGSPKNSIPLAGTSLSPRRQGPEPTMKPVPQGGIPRMENDGGGEVRRQVSRKRAVLQSISNSVDKGNEEYEEIQHTDGKVEKVYSNGAREILFVNGTRKQVSSDGQAIIVSFFNGDMKQIMPDQRVVYYYADAQTTHTTYPDALEILQFPNQQIEKHYPDGTKEITFPDQTIKYLFPNGTEESIYSDGTVIRLEKSGDKTIEFPNGQREIHTPQYKRREYPDGTVKTVYPDGRQETRYSSGRVRVKDQHGSIIVDKRM